MNKSNERFATNNGHMWTELIVMCLNMLRMLPEHIETRLLNFWTYRGGGKTTFLHRLKTALAAPEVAIVGLWDAAALEIDQIIYEILHAVEASSHAKKVVLLDNLDHLLRMGDGEEFFKFERQLVLPLLERDDVLLITTSQIPIHQWREYDVRIHQENHPIRALNTEEVAQLAETWSLDANRLFVQSLGYPQVLCWLQQEPHLSEAELAQRITDYFLAPLPSTARELASVAALLPLFDIAVLRDVLPVESHTEQEGLYAEYVDLIRTLIAIGLVTWDMHMGAYHFPNPTVRRLLARSFQILHPEDFTRVHEKAMTYYQAEARRAGYLHYILVSALYHMAYFQSAQAGVSVGESCKRWVQDNIPIWTGADWPAVLQAWQSGAGDESVNEELQTLLGVEVIAEITQLLTEAQHTMEVAQ